MDNLEIISQEIADHHFDTPTSRANLSGQIYAALRTEIEKAGKRAEVAMLERVIEMEADIDPLEANCDWENSNEIADAVSLHIFGRLRALRLKPFMTTTLDR